MQINETLRTANRKIGQSATFKIFVIGFIMATLLIPSSLVQSLIREREERKRTAIHEMNSQWGQQQTIIGPVLSIPYKRTIKNQTGKKTAIQYAHILPEEVDIRCDISPEMRYRGIYEAVLYNTKIEISGKFTLPQPDVLGIAADQIAWSEAFVAIGISDMLGIKDRIQVDFNGQKVSMEPGVPTSDVINSGISAEIPISPPKKSYPFEVSLNLNGSQQIDFSPVGKITTAAIQSTWKDPSFSGTFLPITRKITKQGFSAKWKVFHLNRNYPQFWTGTNLKISNSTFGVSLFKPADIYQQSMRIAKYALMFIVFTFMAFFLSEVLNQLRVHPIQYFLIGSAVIIFYTLLLAISEHSNFGLAYLISALAVVSLITTYAHSILKSTGATAMVGSLLAILYAYLYILLQVEEYALLMGSIGLFVLLSAIMYVTRKIDWYAIGIGRPADSK